ncbi:MAG: hypothetical protein KF764_10495 [Labilithrix sp.]|nr:hypothetical protein [Labilithrix sp.]
MNLAQKLEQCPSLSRRHERQVEPRTLLNAAAPIDTSDPVDGILVEAGCTLGVVLTALEAMGADTHEGEASDIFTLLLALQRRLLVARELRAVPSEVTGSDADDLGSDENAPASSPRPSPHGVDARDERTKTVNGAGDSLQESLDEMYDTLTWFAGMATSERATSERATHARCSADRAYARAMQARRTLLAEAIP